MPRGLLVAVAALCLATTGGCGPSADSDGTERASEAPGAVEVPDLVAAGDGADATFAAEEAGFTATLVDEDGYEIDGDGTGCPVLEQDPPAGDPAAEGDDITVAVDCRQVEWENQDGDDWDEFNNGYSSGFDTGCDELFNQSPDGSLYEDDYEYTVGDCQSLNPGDASSASDVPSDVPDDPEAVGDEIGQRDGCAALFEESGVSSLNHGADSYTEADCPLGSGGGAGPAASSGGGPSAVQNAAATVRQEGYEPHNTATFDPSNRLRVLIGIRKGSATGHAQRAFFFLGKKYLGTDTADESAAIEVVATTDDTVTLRYVLYKPSDPYCCPTAGKARVRFHWNGARLVPLDAIPASGNKDNPSRR